MVDIPIGLTYFVPGRLYVLANAVHHFDQFRYNKTMCFLRPY